MGLPTLYQGPVRKTIYSSYFEQILTQGLGYAGDRRAEKSHSIEEQPRG